MINLFIAFLPIRRGYARKKSLVTTYLRVTQLGLVLRLVIHRDYLISQLLPSTSNFTFKITSI